jgi:hypothetical protein
MSGDGLVPTMTTSFYIKVRVGGHWGRERPLPQAWVDGGQGWKGGVGGELERRWDGEGGSFLVYRNIDHQIMGNKIAGIGSILTRCVGFCLRGDTPATPNAWSIIIFHFSHLLAVVRSGSFLESIGGHNPSQFADFEWSGSHVLVA